MGCMVSLSRGQFAFRCPPRGSTESPGGKFGLSNRGVKRLWEGKGIVFFIDICQLLRESLVKTEPYGRLVRATALVVVHAGLQKT